MSSLQKSQRLHQVSYDIRGPLLQMAQQMENHGHHIIKMNIGNPAPYRFNTPDEMLQDVISNLSQAQGYCDAKGLFVARKAVMHYTQQCGVRGISTDDIYMGNGVSELIQISMQALLNPGDEVLIPAPDYPLWSAMVNLCGAKAVYYRCVAEEQWAPDLAHIQSLITERSRAILLINPNNPTGAVYTAQQVQAIAALCEQHNLILLSDEIYDKIIFDQATHYPAALTIKKTLCITYGGLSKNYRAAGLRSGWMILSGNKVWAQDFIEGLDLLAAMRLCANVPAQLSVQTALGGYQSINDLVRPQGRLYQQRAFLCEALNEIEGISCDWPQGALYVFPKIDPACYPQLDDHTFALQLLQQEKVLVVPGRSFHCESDRYFRLTLLPHIPVMEEAIRRIKRLLARYYMLS